VTNWVTIAASCVRATGLNVGLMKRRRFATLPPFPPLMLWQKDYESVMGLYAMLALRSLRSTCKFLSIGLALYCTPPTHPLTH